MVAIPGRDVASRGISTGSDRAGATAKSSGAPLGRVLRVEEAESVRLQDAIRVCVRRGLFLVRVAVTREQQTEQPARGRAQRLVAVRSLLQVDPLILVGVDGDVQRLHGRPLPGAPRLVEV